MSYGFFIISLNSLFSIFNLKVLRILHTFSFLFMQFKYNLDQEDFLQFQLFTHSQIPMVQRKRKRTRILVPIVYILLAMWLYFKDPTNNLTITVILIALSIIWFFFYSKFENNIFIKRLKKYIHANYSNNLPMEVNIDLLSDKMVSTVGTHPSSETLYNDIESLQETDDYLFLKVQSSGQSFIFPKKKIQDASTFSKHFQKIAEEHQIYYHNFGAWKL